MNSVFKIKLLLVDDHAIVRAGYRALFAKQADLEVVAEAADGQAAYQQFKTYQPDVVIMDLSLPGISGVETIARIKQRCANAKILVFSMHQHPSYALQATRAGALGYITKSSPPEMLLRGIRTVMTGQCILSPDIAQALAIERLGRDRHALDSLSVREFEIFRLLTDAQSPESIAQLLHISPKTVSNCHSLIKRKLGVNSDIELTRLAIHLQILNLSNIASETQRQAISYS